MKDEPSIAQLASEDASVTARRTAGRISSSDLSRHVDMKKIRLASNLFIIYAATILANGLFYTWWSQDKSEWPPMFLRVAAAIVIAIGLRRLSRLAWWLGIIFSALLTLLGLLVVPLSILTGALETRPYPMVDYIFLILAALSLGCAFLFLSSRSARQAIRNR